MINIKRALALIFLILFAGSAQAQLSSSGGGRGALAFNKDALLLVLPQNDVNMEQLNCFSNANDVADVYGKSAFLYQNAVGGQTTGPGNLGPTGYFSGSPMATAQFCVIRIGSSGTRSRIFGATVCSGASGGTACESETNTSALTALTAITAGTLNWTQNGVALCVGYGGCGNSTPIDLSGSANIPAAALIVKTALRAEVTALGTGATGAALAASTIAPESCPGVAGTMAAGVLTVSSVTSNCIYLGAVIVGTGIVGSPIVGAQRSGTPRGAGVYTVSFPATSTTVGALAPITCTTCTANYSMLTVGTIGSTDTIASGQGLQGSAPVSTDLVGIYGELTACTGIVCTDTQPASCVGAACAGTTWVLAAGTPNQLTVASTAFTATICPAETADTPYSGATVNTSRIWEEQGAFCTTGMPKNTLSYFTSQGSGATDNLATTIGWAINSPGVVTVAPPAGLFTQQLYSGPWLEYESELIGDSEDAKNASNTGWLAWLYATFPQVYAIGNLQIWLDPDGGMQTPTYKNAISTWMAANAPSVNYARVWADNSYPQANYTLNTPYGLPACTPNSVPITVSATWTPDYCPVHDYIMVGAGGNSGNGGIGASANGGVGASGTTQWMGGVTTDSCCIPITEQVGVAGGGHTSGNDTEFKNWILVGGGSNFFAPSGANASGTASGAAATCAVNAVLSLGSFSTYTCFSGHAGGSASATSGAGGEGGSAAASLIAVGGVSGVQGTAAGGGGGAGTSGNGQNPVTLTGGQGGTNLDGATAGAGGALGADGVQYGGGGAGISAAGTAGKGAIGYSGTEFTTLPAHPCSTGGNGGGGGGGGGNKSATGTTIGGAGGNAGNYGASGGAGGGVAEAAQTPGVAGTSSGGFICVVGYQDH
jgi:hypothetical protein